MTKNTAKVQSAAPKEPETDLLMAAKEANPDAFAVIVHDMGGVPVVQVDA